MQFEDLVFTPPDDLEAVATTVMERGRRRRQARRTRLVGVTLALALLGALAPMLAAASRSSGRIPTASEPDIGERPVPRGPRDGAPAPGRPADVAFGLSPTIEPGGTSAAGGPSISGPRPPLVLQADRVAFVSAGASRLNDIFLYDAASGRTTALTTDPAVDSWPTWSPDARRLAFYSDRAGAANVYVMAADGSAQRRITQFDAGYQATQPAWSPDGSLIAFTLSRRPVAHASVTEVEDFGIWVVGPDGSNPRKLLDQAAQPAWSPDGRHLAFVAEDELKVANLITGQVRTVVIGFVNLPAWSPDGTRLTYQRSTGGRDQIFVVNADGTNPRQAFVSDAFDYAPSFSPDGKRLVFRHDPDGPERLYCEDFDPAPSGCQTTVGTAPGQLWVIDFDGNAAGPLIKGRAGDDFLPRFAPRPRAAGA